MADGALCQLSILKEQCSASNLLIGRNYRKNWRGLESKISAGRIIPTPGTLMSQINFLEQLMQERRALSVSELTARVKILVEGQFPDVWVEGEISNFRRHTSGHWYFTLKDEGAMLRCASFRMQNRLIR